ncbi:MAG: hypothetical protein FWD14_05370 [Treponema sp.]|nr:hypothetical protein [Treponema sp.]
MNNMFKTAFISFILFVSFFVMSCPEPFSPLYFDDTPPNLPPGMGYITLSLADENSRTIKPAAITPNSYGISFYETGTGNLVLQQNPVSFSAPFFLLSGNYYVIVDAYLNNDLVMSGRENNINISAGSGENKTVRLEAIIDIGVAGSKGTFSWEVIFPDFVTVAEMSIVPINPVNTSEARTIDFITSPLDRNTSIQLNVGYYNVFFNLKRSGDHNEIQHLVVLHVYQNMLSRYVFNVTQDYFTSLNHTVVLIYDNGMPPETQTYAHGADFAPATITKTKDAYLYLGTPPDNIGYVFDGWYTDDDSPVLWETGDKVLGNRTLIARWTSSHIDLSGRPEATEAEKAIAHAKASAAPGNEFTLYIRNSVSIAPQVMNVSSTNLTIAGLTGTEAINNSGTGVLFNVGANAASSNKLAVFNIKLNGELFIYQTAELVLSGGANIEIVTLVSDLGGNSSVTINSNWTGEINTLNLFGLQPTITGSNSVISNWENRNVIKGTVNPAVINKINDSLGYFRNNFSAPRAITGNTTGANYQIELVDGEGLLRVSNLGTEQNPFLVTNEDELRQVGRGTGEYSIWTLSAHYKQTADLNMFGITWTPIGVYQNEFKGSYNGNGYEIRNINITGTNDVGLFGSVHTDGLIINVNLINVSFAGTSYIGGLVGYNEGAITNCHVVGSVSGQSHVGGLAGFNRGEILNSSFEGFVTSTSTGTIMNTGGIAGDNRGTVQGCYFKGGKVSGNNRVGGVVGSNTSIVRNSYATGEIEGNDIIGGVVGLNSRAPDTVLPGVIQSCYFIGDIKGSSSIGGIVGQNAIDYIIQNCYFVGTISGDNGIGGITGFNSGIAQNCYVIGNLQNLTATIASIGGAVGQNGNAANVGTIRNCVVLNPRIVTTNINNSVLGRVVGSQVNGQLNNNYARQDMDIRYNTAVNGTGGIVLSIINNANGIDGANIIAADFNTQTWWNTTAWSTTGGAFTWDFDNIWMWNPVTNLPILRNMPGNPAQNHTAP